MPYTDPKTAYAALRRRVLGVARLHRSVAVGRGAGLLIWRIGLPLLLVTGLHLALGLPFYLRAPVPPLVAAALLVGGWALIGRPGLARYGITRAAMLVESNRPDLRSRVVSAVELYPDLEAEQPRYDAGLVSAAVCYAQQSTQDDDFRAVIDRGPAQRHLCVALITLALWGGAFLWRPHDVCRALVSMARAWEEVGDLVRRAAGAGIEIDALGQKAFLKGSDVTIRARQRGFRREHMTLHVLTAQGQEATSMSVAADADGNATYTFEDVQETFGLYLSAGRIGSDRRLIVVTERPRIVTLTVEYEWPEYVRRAPAVQPRSDGNLRALYGSTVILTIEANKELASAVLTGSFASEATALSVGGRYARGVIRVDDRRWLDDPRPSVQEWYSLRLVGEYGYANADADRRFDLEIVKDRAPVVELTGLPHRSPAHEPHVIEENLSRIGVALKASDDYGVKKVVLHCRLESLETDRELSRHQKTKQFAMPRAQVPRLHLLSLSEAGAKVGDRIVFWAEAEDAYDLEPEQGPHRSRTPAYRVAVVTQEELFAEVRYKDTWSVPWYDKQKIATLSKREAPPRQAPTREDPAKVAAKLLDVAPAVDELTGADARIAQEYFDSLGAAE